MNRSQLEASQAEYESRIARKSWECHGSGGGGDRLRHAEGCSGTIKPGEVCIELLDEAPAYTSGPRCCLACAEAFHGIDTALVLADRKPSCQKCGGNVDHAGRCEACGALA